MTKCAPAWRLFLFLFLAFFLAGCSQFRRGSTDDEKDPHFLEGKRRLGGMDWDGAIQSFERALQSNPNNAAAHFQLGVLYYQVKNDFPAAIYHYQRHLKLQPDSRMAQIITQHIEFSRRELAKTDGFTPVDRDVQRELERLSMTNKALQKRIEFLEAQLARGPQYITNYVTNFVKLPEFPERGTRSLTQPALIVDRPADDEPPPRTSAPTDPSSGTALQAQNPQRQVAANTSNRNGNPANGGRRTTTTKAATTAARSHLVRPGQTMEVLARLHGVSVSELKKANPGTERGVRAGQTIVIPAR